MSLLLQNFDLVARTPDGVAQLRKQILELAVRGRLVPQDQDDEPASVLLQKIKAEKALLVKAGKIKAPKELPEIREGEKPYELPAGWEWVRIRAITHDWGQCIPDSNFSYIDVSSIDNKPGRLSERIEVVTAKEAPSRARKIVKVGTIIYSTVRPYLLNTAIIKDEIKPNPIASTAFAVLHPFSVLNGEYLHWYLRSQSFTDYVSSKMIGMAYPAINDAQLSLGLVPLPPLAEQSRIVARVQELMAVLDRLEARSKEAEAARGRSLVALTGALSRASSKAEQEASWKRLSSGFEDLVGRAEDVKALRAMVLELAVRGRLVPQDRADEPASVLLEKIKAEKARLVKAGKIKAPKELPEIREEEKPYELPTGWEWVRADTIGEIKLGRQRSPENHRGPNMVPYLRVANVFEGFIDVSDINTMNFTIEEQKTFALSDGDLLLNEGQSYELVGRPAIYRNEVPGACFQNTLIRVRPIILSMSEFLLVVFRSYMRSGRFRQEAQQTTNIAHLSASRLAMIELPLPPLAEQSRIVARVQELMAVLDRLEAKLGASEEAARQFAEAVARVG